VADACDALVIGAGVVGISTAYALAARGLSVTIVDAGPEPGRGASFANGAQLSYVYTDALASPWLLKNLPALALGRDPAFRLRPSVDPDFIRWGLAFLRNCSAARFRSNTLEGLRLGLESRAAMHRLLMRHRLEFGHSVAGKLHLLEGKPALDAARDMIALKRAGGAVQVLMGPEEAARLEPAIGGRANDLSGVVYSPQEEVGDPYLFCAALMERLTSDYGVATRFGSQVERIQLAGGGSTVRLAGGEHIRARRIAICTGVGTPRLLRGTGIKVPIWPMKGYSVTAEPGPEAPRISITDVARKLVFCSLSGSIRIAGLADLGSRDTSVNKRRLDSLLRAARDSLPRAADYGRLKSSWSGLRPMTPRSLPVIRREKGGVVLNVGHGTLGWTYAMGAAERAADLVVQRPC
jgi:D-amino-acid dehydrogenase